MLPPTPTPSEYDPVKHFECLLDEPELWAKRLQRSDAFRDKYCHGKALDIYTLAAPVVVPIVFVFWVTNHKDFATFRMLALSVNTAAKFNDVVILLLFGDGTSARDMQLELDGNVIVYQAAADEDLVQQAFDSFGPPLYIHRSVNSFDYELFCFKRWFAAHKYLELHGHRHAFFADNDVLVLSNITRDAAQCFTGCRCFGILVYAIYYRVEMLGEFVQYVRDLYAQPEAASVLRQVEQKYGVVSDMTVQLEFIEYFYQQRGIAPQQGTLCTARRPPPEKLGLAHRGAMDGAFYEFEQDDLGLPHMIANGTAPHLFQVVHFQGWRKAILQTCNKREHT